MTMVKVPVNAADIEHTDVFIFPTSLTKFRVVHTPWSLHK
jgi:hypothetical protein